MLLCVCFLGHLAVAPGSDRLSAANTGRITACTLFHDTSRTFEPRRVGGSTGPRIYCAVCRSARLDIHALPDMHSVLSLDSVSDGQHVLGSNPAGAFPYHFNNSLLAYMAFVIQTGRHLMRVAAAAAVAG